MNSAPPASSGSPSPAHPQEPPPEATFKSYTPQQASLYAKARPSYPPTLYVYILSHHRSTGGRNDVLLDVGCGPGIATRDLASNFDTAYGVDSGQEMIAAAQGFVGMTRTGKHIKYFVGEAERVHKIEEIVGGGVDLVTAGTAAHWFDMPKFWASVAKVLKPGGTVALWSMNHIQCHPTTPNAPQVQAVINHFRDTILRPYMLPPSRINANMYRDIPLPWDDPSTASLFDKTTFIYNKSDTNFFGGSRKLTLATFRKSSMTMDSITRWREAHPELAGTERDVVWELVERLRDAMGRAKEEDLADIEMEVGMSIVVLLVKRTDVVDK